MLGVAIFRRCRGPRLSRPPTPTLSELEADAAIPPTDLFGLDALRDELEELDSEIERLQLERERKAQQLRDHEAKVHEWHMNAWNGPEGALTRPYP